MTLIRNLLGTNPVSGAVDPEAVSFDGTNDYLSRSSSLNGASASNTFTFSVWLYRSSDDDTGIYQITNTSNSEKFKVYYSIPWGESNGTQLAIFGKDNTGATPLEFFYEITGGLNTWTHIMVSIDLSDVSKRYLYQDGVDRTSDIVWGAYLNGNIEFSQSLHTIAAYRDGNSIIGKHKGRLAHLFLDDTYLDLSVEANRRLFIDSDGKPSSTIPSNPILYLPMTDAATAGSNSGTGGDFTVNGVLDTAGRGPNQDNCSARSFDGSNDFLDDDNNGFGSTYYPSTSKATVSFIFSSDIDGDGLISSGSNFITVNKSSPDRLHAECGKASAGVQVSFWCQQELGQNDSVQIVFDTVTQANNKMYVNGVSKTLTFITTPAGSNIGGVTSRFRIGRSDATVYWNGKLGEVWIQTGAVDLATSNPFYDSSTNRHITVRQVLEDTGVTPLFALPLNATNPELNLGYKPDLYVHGGTVYGVRGGSEFWARSVSLALSAHVTKSFPALSTRKFSIVVATRSPNVNALSKILIGTGDAIVIELTGPPSLKVRDGSTIIGSMDAQGITTSSDTWYTHLISFDSDSSAGTHWYINGVNAVTSKSVSSGDIGIGGAFYAITGAAAGTEMGFLWFATDHIDFSQEANRNLFVDQLGYPKDLSPAIDAGDIPTPLVYMKFDDTSAFGTNTGTGGNLTVGGTVTAGADVQP